jgi:hypothetical protein
VFTERLTSHWAVPLRSEEEKFAEAKAAISKSLEARQRADERQRNEIADFGRMTEIQKRMSDHTATVEEKAEFQALAARASQQLDAQRDLDRAREAEREARSNLERLTDERDDITRRWQDGLATYEDMTRVSHLDQEIPDA